MKLIIGLGNPGEEYLNTKHNLGFMVLDNFLKENNIEIIKNKFNSLYTTTILNNQKIAFIKPNTFMNLSGESVIKFINFYKVNIKDILIIYDDKDMELGKYKVKTKSSHGGHNGMRSILNLIGSNEIMRLKIGIGKPPQNIETSKYVLSKFTNTELNILNNNMNVYIEEIWKFINEK